ncbi:hypothetical protein GCM10022252_16640 [Streptosporangium oxazolinicum]|uniref:Uncharacterized protein n=1 Tax=Streptosporangium oxazolinicum TaxID=909287 RepID=A0ABP8AL42_9ACTN
MSAFTLAVAAQVEAERCQAVVGQSVGHPGEEAAFVTRHPAAVDQDDGVFWRSIWCDERSGELLAIESPEGDLMLCRSHL